MVKTCHLLLFAAGLCLGLHTTSPAQSYITRTRTALTVASGESSGVAPLTAVSGCLLAIFASPEDFTSPTYSLTLRNHLGAPLLTFEDLDSAVFAVLGPQDDTGQGWDADVFPVLSEPALGRGWDIIAETVSSEAADRRLFLEVYRY